MTYHFEVRTGIQMTEKPYLPEPSSVAEYLRLLSGNPINYQDLRQEAGAGRVRSILLA